MAGHSRQHSPHRDRHPLSQASPSDASPPLREPRLTVRELRATNKYACSHCGITFGKASDRLNHWKKSCRFLGVPDLPVNYPGDAEVCRECDYVARNETKKQQHEKTTTHSGNWDWVTLNRYRRFTSCDKSIIYDNPQVFFERFREKGIVYNHQDEETFPKNQAHLRLRTLLQEGRATDGSPHTSTYAALNRHCLRSHLNEDDWQRIVAGHTPEDAMKFAQKLEWGHRHPPDSAVLCRLGFTNLDEMISEVVPLGLVGPSDTLLPEWPTSPGHIVNDNISEGLPGPVHPPANIPEDWSEIYIDWAHNV